MESYKVYVDVNADFSRDGILRPASFIWEDGTRYEISHVKRSEQCASRKAGGTGIRYTCVVGGRECHLFLEENRWFMERK